MTDAPSSPQPRLPAAEAPDTTELRRRDAELTERLASQDAKRAALARQLQQLDEERAKTAEVKSRNDEQLSARESAREVAARDADDVAPAKGDEAVAGGTDFGLEDPGHDAVNDADDVAPAKGDDEEPIVDDDAATAAPMPMEEEDPRGNRGAADESTILEAFFGNLDRKGDTWGEAEIEYCDRIARDWRDGLLPEDEVNGRALYHYLADKLNRSYSSIQHMATGGSDTRQRKQFRASIEVALQGTSFNVATRGGKYVYRPRTVTNVVDRPQTARPRRSDRRRTPTRRAAEGDDDDEEDGDSSMPGTEARTAEPSRPEVATTQIELDAQLASAARERDAVRTTFLRRCARYGTSTPRSHMAAADARANGMRQLALYRVTWSATREAHCDALKILLCDLEYLKNHRRRATRAEAKKWLEEFAHPRCKCVGGTDPCVICRAGCDQCVNERLGRALDHLERKGVLLDELPAHMREEAMRAALRQARGREIEAEQRDAVQRAEADASRAEEALRQAEQAARLTVPPQGAVDEGARVVVAATGAVGVVVGTGPVGSCVEFADGSNAGYTADELRDAGQAEAAVAAVRDAHPELTRATTAAGSALAAVRARKLSPGMNPPPEGSPAEIADRFQALSPVPTFVHAWHRPLTTCVMCNWGSLDWFDITGVSDITRIGERRSAAVDLFDRATAHAAGHHLDMSDFQQIPDP